MNAIDALARLRSLNVPVITTADAATALGQSTTAASSMLARLGKAELLTPLRHGSWLVESSTDVFRLPELLSAPSPSYVSLQSALHYHGLIEQIPSTIYAVSLTRTQRIATKLGTFSFHHVAPEVFDGFEENAAGAKIATAEKALFDFAYLSAGRTRLFTSLPELEVSTGFRVHDFIGWLARIPSQRSRTITERKLDAFLQQGRLVDDRRGEV